MYRVIYDTRGERFEILNDMAQKLILNHGWTQSPPIILEEALIDFDSIQIVESEPEARAASVDSAK